MGNTIIRASHVGAVQRQVGKYKGPPSEEDLAIAKRAATLTRQRWKESEKLKKAKSKAKLAKKKLAQERKSAAKAKRQAAKDKTISTASTKQKTENQSQKLKQQPTVRAAATRTPAQRLGISESELDRRLNALRKFHSNS